MKLLKEITDQTIQEGLSESYDKPYRLRKAGRAVLFNGNKISLQYVSKHNYHKLPGGGVEECETIKEALKREIQEEVGCDIAIKKPIGIVIEYRNKFKLLQISYCYFGEVVGFVGEPVYSETEIAGGFKPIWVTLDEAINLLENDKPNDYQGKFIKIRDLTFLKEAKEILKNS